MSCGSASDVTDPHAAKSEGTSLSSLTLTSPLTEFGVADYTFVHAEAYGDGGVRVPATKITWAVDDGSVAWLSVMNDSVVAVIGKAVGATNVIATSGATSSRISINVLAAEVGSIVLAPRATAVELGSSRSLQVVAMTKKNQDIPRPSAIWSSSDSSIVAVDQSGLATAERPGSVTITARIDTLVATATVHVPTAYKDVAAGQLHSCSLKPSGEAWCWGANGGGQLGDGTTLTRYVPVQVATTLTFVRIYALGAASCGLDASGQLFCWGSNDRGWLGVENTSSRVPFPSRVNAPEPFVQVATGASHICAIGQSKTTYCWGVGFGAGAPKFGLLATPTPVDVPGGSEQLVAGSGYSCALNESQEAFCWGGNNYGQLGNGVHSTWDVETGTATPQKVIGGHSFLRLFAGSAGDHTCGIELDGTSYCWGDYVENGQAPTTTSCEIGSDKYGPILMKCSPTPVRVTAPAPFVEISTGAGSTCGVVAAGDVFCWGRLNIGSETFEPTAKKIESTVRLRSVTAGWWHFCGLSDAGLVYCWGRSMEGEVGDMTVLPIIPGSLYPEYGYGRGSFQIPTLIAAP